MNAVEISYRHERGGPDTSHHGFLHWPGLNGIPFRSRTASTPLLFGSELKALPRVHDFHAERFQLWKPDAMSRYTDIQSRIATGWYRAVFVQRTYNSEHDMMSVYLEWYQIYIDYP